MKRAAPPKLPFFGHRNMAQTMHGGWNRKPGEMRVLKGWWPSTIAGYDIAGRKL